MPNPELSRLDLDGVQLDSWRDIQDALVLVRAERRRLEHTSLRGMTSEQRQAHAQKIIDACKTENTLRSWARDAKDKERLAKEQAFQRIARRTVGDDEVDRWWGLVNEEIENPRRASSPGSALPTTGATGRPRKRR